MAYTTYGPLESGTHEIVAAGSTAQTVKSGSSTFFGLEADNSANSVVCYVKVYNLTTVNPASNVPDWVFEIPTTGVFAVYINGGLGTTLATGISVRCVTGKTDTDTTAPTNSVSVKVITS